MHYFFNSYDSEQDKTLTGAASTSKICLLCFSSKCGSPGDLTGVEGKERISLLLSHCPRRPVRKVNSFQSIDASWLPIIFICHTLSFFLPPSLHPSFLPSFLSSLLFPLYFYFLILKSNLGHCTCWANILPLICSPNSDFCCFSIMAPTIYIW